MDTLTLSPTSPPAHRALGAARQPALPGFLARCIDRIDWLDGVPDAWALRWVLETCRAELTWSVADYKRVSGDHAERDARYDGPHPAEAYRLPHERAAADILSIHGHLLGLTPRLRLGLKRLRAQRAAGWHAQALGTLDDIRWYWAERRKAWALMVAAIARYRAARDALAMPEAA